MTPQNKPTRISKKRRRDSGTSQDTGTIHVLEDAGYQLEGETTGLSLNRPAHRFHKAILEQVVNQNHGRLGDAILAAQGIYAHTGSLPELITVYHLLGDPALKLR